MEDAKRRCPTIAEFIELEARLARIQYTGKANYDYEMKIRGRERTFKMMFHYYTEDLNFDRCYNLYYCYEFLHYHGLVKGLTRAQVDEIKEQPTQISGKTMAVKMLIQIYHENGETLKSIFEKING